MAPNKAAWSWADYVAQHGPVPNAERRVSAVETPPDEAEGYVFSSDVHSGTVAVVREIAAERMRQQTDECWSIAHDDGHTKGELRDAAAAYALGCSYAGDVQIWPWSDAWWKPKDKRANLVRAGALIVAEIERLDRAAAAE